MRSRRKNTCRRSTRRKIECKQNIIQALANAEGHLRTSSLCGVYLVTYRRSPNVSTVTRLSKLLAEMEDAGDVRCLYTGAGTAIDVYLQRLPVPDEIEMEEP